jgi:integrase
MDLVKLQADPSISKATANRILNYLSALYAWAGENGFVRKGFNPAKGVDRYAQPKRERYLSVVELDRLGVAIREAETLGIPWKVDDTASTAKHIPRDENSLTPVSPQAAAALRLLLFTGARLREILHLRWEHVDIERAALFLPDSKTGRKTIYLNGPALAVLESLPRVSSYVFPGEPRRKADGRKADEQPRWDLKRPWEGIRRMAGLQDVRLHDLRHTHASFGVGGGLGLPVIAKLLGHTQLRTTERYSHLDADPIRRASETIGRRIAEAMGEGFHSSKPQAVPRDR